MTFFFRAAEKLDNTINRVVGAPVVGKANAAAEMTGGTMMYGTTPVSPITGEPEPKPAPPPPPPPPPEPTVVAPVIIPGKTTVKEVQIPAPAPTPAGKPRKQIEVSGDDSAARAAYGAGLLAGDTGLQLDPLGRRGRGATGHATLLGR